MNLWPIYYVLRDARAGAARNLLASVSAVLMVALAVALVAGAWLASGATRSVAALLREQAAMRVILAQPSEGAPSDLRAAEGIARRIRGLPGVVGARVIPPEETFAQLQAAFAGTVDLKRLFPQNPFPPSVAVELSDPTRARAVASEVEGWPGVGEVVYGQRYLPALLGLDDFVRRAGWALALGFALVALAVTVITWQLAVLSRLGEVRVKAWMGVSPWALRGQFALEGALLGLAGGALAALGLVVVVARIYLGLAALAPSFAPAPPRLGALVALCLASGSALGALGAALAQLAAARRGVGAG